MDWLDYREALGIGLSDYDKTNVFIIGVSSALVTAAAEGVANSILKNGGVS